MFNLATKNNGIHAFRNLQTKKGIPQVHDDREMISGTQLP